MNSYFRVPDEQELARRKLYKKARDINDTASRIIKNRDSSKSNDKKMSDLAFNDGFNLNVLQSSQEYNRHKGTLAIIAFTIIFDCIVSYEAIVAIVDTIITESLFGNMTPYLPFILTFLFSVALVVCEIGISLLLEGSTDSSYEEIGKGKYSKLVRKYFIIPLSNLSYFMKTSLGKTFMQYGIILLLPLMSFVAYLNMQGYGEVTTADVNLFLGKTLATMAAAIVCHVNIIQRAEKINRSWTYVTSTRPQLYKQEILFGLIQPKGMLQKKAYLEKENYKLKEQLNKQTASFSQDFSDYLFKFRDMESGDFMQDRDFLCIIPEWVLVHVRNFMGRVELVRSMPPISTNFHKGIIKGENMPTVEGTPSHPIDDDVDLTSSGSSNVNNQFF